MRLQSWEVQAIKDIQTYGGFLTKDELYQLYLDSRPDKSKPSDPRHFRRRRKQLADNKYIYSAPVISREKQEVVDVFYLASEGAKILAGKQKLSGQDRFIYRRLAPRYFDHDYLEAQTHRAVENACSQVKKTKLLEWLHAFQLHQMSIPVTCTNPYTGSSYNHEFVTDSFSKIQHHNKDFRFFWEIDNETRREPLLTKNRLIPFLKMIRSSGIEIYGGRPFRIVWLAHKQERIGQIKSKLENLAKRLGYPQDANYFLLATFDDFQSPQLAIKPIYLQGGSSKRVRLFAS